MIDEQMKVDGYDDAIVGVCNATNRLVYSIPKMVEVFIINSGPFDDDDDPVEIAIEYIEFNIIGAYVGEMTPMYIWDFKKNNDNWGDDT
jgi:hypothetical protein